MKGLKLILVLSFIILVASSAPLTRQITLDNIFPGSVIPDTSNESDRTSRWALLSNARSPSPPIQDEMSTVTQKDSGNPLDDYTASAAECEYKGKSTDDGRYKIWDFGFNLPTEADPNVITIDMVRLNSQRDAINYRADSTKSFRPLDEVYDRSMIFYKNFGGVEDNSVGYIVIDSSGADPSKPVRTWNRVGDVLDAETWRTFELTETQLADWTGFNINQEFFKIEGESWVTNDFTDNAKNHVFAKVFGQLYLTVKYSYIINVLSTDSERRPGEDVTIHMLANSILSGTSYSGLEIAWSCRFTWGGVGEDIVTAKQVNPDIDTILCTVPLGISSGTLVQVEVSNIPDASTSGEFTSAGQTFTIVAGCSEGECNESTEQGTCNISTGLCECNLGFLGSSCSIEACDGLGDAYCNDNGTCQLSTGNCICDTQYTGAYCEIDKCVDENYLDNCSGEERGICKLEAGTLYCDCEDGYTGTTCEIDKCDPNILPCDAEGTDRCEDGFCICNINRKGTYCEQYYCEPDYDKCNAAGECNEYTGNCDCFAGYTGEFCEYIVCEVENIICVHGECVIEKEACVCDKGWTGDDCSEEVESTSFIDKLGDQLGIGSSGVIGLFSVLAVGVSIGAATFGYKAWKKNKERDRWAEILDLPIFDVEMMFGEEYSISASDRKRLRQKDTRRNLFALQELLLDNLNLVDSISRSAETKVASYLSKSILYVYEANGESIELIKYFIAQEVDTCDDGDLLFRGYSMASRLWSSYCHLPVGIEYLHTVLGVPLHELVHEMEKNEMELNPDVVESSSKRSVNKYNLMAAAQLVLSSIAKSHKICPASFKYLLSFLRERVDAKFPDLSRQAVGGMIILRFFTPALTASDDYGVIKDEPSDELLRILILVAKVLQNLANGALFGVKEEYMSELNEFVTDNQAMMNTYLDNISQTEDMEELEELAAESSPLPRDVLEISCANIHRYLLVDKSDVMTILREQMPNETQANELEASLDAILDALGDPVEIQADEEF